MIFMKAGPQLLVGQFFGARFRANKTSSPASLVVRWMRLGATRCKSTSSYAEISARDYPGSGQHSRPYAPGGVEPIGPAPEWQGMLTVPLCVHSSAAVKRIARGTGVLLTAAP